mmetsp:Transcript_4899/g.10790  ORF Transcript_4899/g.10790 Transcript_4899/m.10790 type:complete len:221 (-) Transcript_4899:17-679(-)
MSYSHLSIGPPFTFSMANHSLQLSDSLFNNLSPTYSGILGFIRPSDSVPIFKHLASNNASGRPVPAVFPISLTAMEAWLSSCPSRLPSQTEPKLPTPSSLTRVTSRPSAISILIFGRNRLGLPVESIPLSGGFTSACLLASLAASSFSLALSAVLWPLATASFFGLSSATFLGLTSGAFWGLASAAFWGLTSWGLVGLAAAFGLGAGSFCSALGLGVGSF